MKDKRQIQQAVRKAEKRQRLTSRSDLEVLLSPRPEDEVPSDLESLSRHVHDDERNDSDRRGGRNVGLVDVRLDLSSLHLLLRLSRLLHGSDGKTLALFGRPAERRSSQRQLQGLAQRQEEKRGCT